MPVRSSVVGATSSPYRAACDARWLMAYAAGLGLTDSSYFDTTRPGGVLAHPLFPVGPEWGLLTTAMGGIDYGLAPGEAVRGVHAGHDLVLHRAVRQDDVVTVTGTVHGVEATPPGARVTLRLDAVDASDAPVWTTWYVTIYRDVSVDGPDVGPWGRPDPPGPVAPTTPAIDRRSVQIGAAAAHIYTECARIWNPIHTDTAVARAAGLPGPILHGTATLAHGVSETVEMLGLSADTVRRLGGSFRAMVPMPATLTVELLAVERADGAQVARYRVVTGSGDVAVSNGFLVAQDA